MNIAPTIPIRPHNDSRHVRTRRIKLTRLLAAAVSFLWIAPLQIRAVAEDDVVQLAINYVFTGRIDPPDRPVARVMRRRPRRGRGGTCIPLGSLRT